MSTNAQRFGQIVKARRDELDLTQLEVHDAGGPSNSTQTNIESGRLDDLTKATAKKLDKGLRWKLGSARAAWNGGAPSPLDGRPDFTHRELDELRRYIGATAVDEVLRRRLLEAIDEAEGVKGA